MANRIGVAKAAPESATGEALSSGRADWAERSGRLYEELRSPSTRMIRRAFGRAFGDDEIEDIYGNAWLGTLRTLERRHAELSDEEIRRYVFTAVAHHASKELRRRGRKPTAPLEAVGEVADIGPAPDDHVAGDDERRLARDLIASLPPRRRAVMLLRYGCGLEPRQVCALVSGLTARSYRKEITKGVDELTEKLRMVEQGDWCAEREPLMKAFAAGIASEEETRQARHHLSRCRDCADLVGRLNGHLHDLSGMLTMPAALAGIAHGSGAQDRVIALVDRARDALPGPLGSTDAATLAASGTARGGAATGAGLLTKLAGFSVSGKVAVACLAGGAVATTCAATGLLPPLAVPDVGGPAKEVAASSPHMHGGARHPAGPIRDEPRGAAAFAASAQPATPEPQAPPRSEKTPPANDVTVDVTTSTTATTPIAPTTPPVQRQFGLPAAAPTPATGSSGSGGGTTGGGSPAQQEFGP